MIEGVILFVAFILGFSAVLLAWLTIEEVQQLRRRRAP